MTEAGMVHNALAFCRQNPIARMLPLAALERGTARVVALKDGALLAYDPTFKGHMLCWDDEAQALALLRGFQSEDLLMLEYATLKDEAQAFHGFTGGMVAYGCAYLHKQPLPVKKPVRLELLGPEDLAMVAAHNREAGEELLSYALKEGRLYAGRDGQTLVGFIGFHEEGSLGMLYVVEGQRRRGYAAAMEALLVNRLLLEGKRVFGQIRVGNEASLSLHRGMGYTIADAPGSWHWR